MSVPSIHDIVQSDLSTSEAELREKFPQTSVERLLAQVGSPLAIENAHRNLLDMEDDE